MQAINQLQLIIATRKLSGLYLVSLKISSDSDWTIAFFCNFIRLQSFITIPLLLYLNMAGDPASSFELFKRSPQNVVLDKYIRNYRRLDNKQAISESEI